MDSVLEEIQQGQGQEPTLQEMLKARAEEVGTVTESEAEAGTAEEPEPQEPVAEQLELETDSVTETVTEGSDGKAPEPVVELEPEHPDAPRTIEETYEEMKLTPKERDMVLDGRLRTVLRTPKQRGAVPTLVRYRQDGQLALVQDLLLATTAPVIDVFSPSSGELSPLSGQPRLRLFSWELEGRSLPNIFSDAMFARAKRINLRYAHLYGGTEETPENLEQEWSRLDGFTRYSNVSAADYHEMRLRMLDTLGWPADGEKLSAAQLEYLAELEHIRWCRYHYLNNWRWGKPENGARKDPAKRIHADLIPYGEPVSFSRLAA